MCLVSFSKKEEYSSKDKLKGFDNKPKWAYVEITNSCSHKCAWCYGEFSEDKNDYMSVEEFQVVADKCKEMGITQITLSGGEPTEHPDFEQILAVAASNFAVNVATHGDWKQKWAGVMKVFGVKQVQFNYQGSKRHDGVHKVKSYDNQIDSMKAVKNLGIDLVGTVTVGAYNFSEVRDIFRELSDLGVSRLRVWEATGYGNRFRKDKEATDIFEACENEAKQLGYNYVQSYDPAYEGDIGVKCLSLSKIFVYISANSQVLYCGAVPSLREKPISDFKTDTAQDILEKYNNMMDSMAGGQPYCAARL